MNLEEKLNHNQNFREFSETEAINLKKVASFFSRYNPFPSWPSAAQDTYFYRQSTSGISLNRSRPFFWVFTCMSRSFGFLK